MKLTLSKTRSKKIKTFLAIAILGCASAALVTPAEAKKRHSHKHHRSVHAKHEHGRHHRGYMPRFEARAPQGEAFTNSEENFSPRYPVVEEQPRSRRAQRARATVSNDNTSSSMGFASTGVVAEARRYLGGNPTGRRILWCGAFMDMVLKRTGHAGGGNLARSYASYGRRVSGPQVGAIAVMSRGKRGGHVGVVSGVDASGNPIIISGNHGGRVAESTYSRGRVYAYVMP
jgi:uncharacterized protein (TIGR02594 family)